MTSFTIPGSNLSSTALTTFTVKVDGEALPGSYGIVAIDIKKELNRIPCASIVLYDGDAAKQDFELSSGDRLIPGKTIEIDGGYHLDESLVFKGIITGQRIKVKRQGDSLLYIEARDLSFRMTLDRKSKYFTELTDSDLFEEIIANYPGLTSQVAATAIAYPEIVQYQVSDWDLIVTRAERLGMYCFPDDGILRIEPPDLNQESVLTLSYGQNIFEVDLELDSRSQYSKVSAFAWDDANQEVISSDIEDLNAPDQGNLTGAELAKVGAIDDFELRHSGSLQQQELDAWAAAKMLKSRFSQIRGTISFQGNGSAKLGGLVKLAGMGDRFNGTALISGVRHMLGDGDWQTIVQIGLQPEWHLEKFPVHAPLGANAHPAIQGLHVGIVTQLQDDPASSDRILVRVPLIGEQDQGIWSRIATLDAGANRGTVFRPEIGDEVVLGFINNDPNEAIVLGMFHSSSNPAPIAANDDNPEKGLVTKSGMKVIFDDENSSMTIETPNANKIVISDQEQQIVLQDQTGNTVTMSTEGITLDSPKNLILQASGDVSVEGLNISIKAKTSATVEGSTGASLKSGGNTDVKGSLVRLN